MCLNPVRILTRSKNGSLKGSALYHTIKCGDCAECRAERANEYLLRSYYQYKETLDKGGYCYFETLTYAPEHLPMKFGIPHFSKRDIRLFLMRLRKHLGRRYDVKDNLKYYLVSEYGGKTHRPHYHILFFCTVPKLTVFALRYAIFRSWQKGFIDKFNTVRKRVVNGLGVLHYVAKYVNKDSDYISEVDGIKNKLFERYGDTYQVQRLVEDMQPFHQQSSGFGLGALKYQKYEDYFDSGMMFIPDKKQVKKYIPIPQYLKHKVFYDCVKYFEDGKTKYRWIINDKGIAFRWHRLYENIDLLAKRYEKIYNNIEAYSSTIEQALNYKQMIYDLMDGRDFTDFAIYLYVYKDKLWYNQDRYVSYHKNTFSVVHRELPSIEEIFDCNIKSVYGSDVFYLYESYIDVNGYTRCGLVKSPCIGGKSLRDINRLYRITEKSFIEFDNFDRIFSLFNRLLYIYNKGKQAEYDRKQEIKSRLKLLDI